MREREGVRERGERGDREGRHKERETGCFKNNDNQTKSKY
jgi:hypothetical protein